LLLFTVGLALSLTLPARSQSQGALDEILVTLSATSEDSEQNRVVNLPPALVIEITLSNGSGRDLSELREAAIQPTISWS